MIRTRLLARGLANMGPLQGGERAVLVLYEVPEGIRTIVREIFVVSGSPGGGTNLSVNVRSASTDLPLWIEELGTAPYFQLHLVLDQVLEFGEGLSVSTAFNNIAFHVSGAELML